MGETVKVLDRNGVLQLCSALKTKNDFLYVSKSGGSISVDWSSVQNKPSFANVAISGSYSDLSNKPTIPAATDASNQITAMTGYSKPSSASAIAATDTLNQAIGKLEYKVDNASGGSGTSDRIYSTKKKLSEFVDVQRMTDVMLNCGGLGDGHTASDISNNGDCCILYKEGNMAYFKVNNGLKITVAMHRGSCNCTMHFNYNLPIEQGFRPNKYVYGNAYAIRYTSTNLDDGDEVEHIVMPCVALISPNGELYVNFAEAETKMDNNEGDSPIDFLVNIDMCYPLVA